MQQACTRSPSQVRAERVKRGGTLAKEQPVPRALGADPKAQPAGEGKAPSSARSAGLLRFKSAVRQHEVGHSLYVPSA